MRRGRLLAIGVVTCVAGLASLAHASPADDYMRIKRDWASDQRITPCRWTIADLENARDQLSGDDEYSDFADAIRAEIRRQRSSDPCPGPARAPGSPVLDRVRFTHPAFRVGAGPTALAARAPVGTRILWRISEPATVRIGIERAPPHGRARRVGTLRRNADAGSGSLAFTGRLGRRRLAPGTYRARLVAIDADGLRSSERQVRFTIVR